LSESATSHFSAQAQQYAASNIQTLQKLRTMQAVHDKIFATGDFSRANLETVIHPDIKYYESGQEVTPAGIEGVMRRFSEFRNAFHFDVARTVVALGQEEWLANRYDIEATHVGAFQGIAPTRAKVLVSGIKLLRVQNGQITECHDAFDGGAILAQLRKAG
jgi:predicted ester cyclase